MRGHLRQLIGFLLAPALFLGALWLLQRELAHYELAGIVAIARGYRAATLASALGLTFASYSLLTLYDVLALHHVGHRLSYPRTALTSFVSYVTSHNLGLSGIGGTAVRYRLYSVFGLSAAEIAQVVAFCALTFWEGFLFLAGVFQSVAPIELPAALHAPFADTRALGFVCLGLSLAFGVASCWPGLRLRWRGWSFTPPSARLLALQLPLALLEWTVSASVLYVLLPRAQAPSFPAFASVFLAAQAAGMISHVPAGLGVFETVVLYLLPEPLGSPEIVAALLAYRVVYYLVPLCFGALAFLATEAGLRRAQIGELGARLQPIGQLLVPRALAFTTALAGGVLLLTGALPAEGARMAWIRDVVPLPVVELSHFLGSLVGVGLLLLARGLQRRLDVAWWLSALLLTAGIVFALARGLDYEEATLLALMLCALLPFRGAFHRKSSLFDLPLRAGWILNLVLILAGAAWLGLLVHRDVAYRSELWWHFSYAGDAPRFLRASVAAGTLLVLVGLVRALREAPPPLHPPTPEELGEVRAILAQVGETTGHLARLGDKQLLFGPQRGAFVMFAVRERSWIAMGDPVGVSSAERRELVWLFRERAERAGGRAVFYQVSQENLGWYVEAGFGLLKLGEEARVDLAAFSLEGGEHKSLRSNLHRLEREGLRFVLWSPDEVRARIAELEAVSRAWLATKSASEKGFSLGFFEREYIAGAPVAVVLQGERGLQGERVLAFANLWLGARHDRARGGELSVDLMRHLPDAPGGLMDFLFVRLFEWGRAQGYGWFSLGMAPLAGLESRASAPLWNRLATLVFQHGERFYNFQGLRQYKQKFTPEWRARYLASPGGVALPGVLVDLAALISGGLAKTIHR